MHTSSNTPTVAEAFEQAQGTLKSDSSSETEEVEVESTQESEDIPQEEPKDEPEEEADLEKFDPEKLPNELKPVYKNLMKGFTQGRQKDAEKAKEAEQRAKQLEERLAKLETATQPEQEQPKFDSPEEYWKWQAQQTAKEEVEKERLEGYRSQALSDFEEADPRLKKGEEFDPVMRSAIGSQLDELLADHIQKTGSEIGFPHKTHLKDLITQYEEHVQKQVQTYIKKQNERNRKQADQAKKQVPKSSNAKSIPDKVGGIRDAIKLAQEKLSN